MSCHEHGQSSCCQDEGPSNFAQIGERAPGISLEGYFKNEIRRFSMEEYEGKWIILFFYPLDFTFVCPTELTEISKRHDEFEKLDAQVLGISVDSVHSHKAWSKEIGDLNFPLLSDLTKESGMEYNVLIPEKGICLRGTFIISPDRILKSIIVNDLEVGRNTDEILRIIKALKTGELCPINWKPGEKTLGKA